MYQFFSRPDAWVGLCGHMAFLPVRRTLPGPDWLRGLRALFVTDFHVPARYADADLDAFAQRLAALKPDLLLLGGDYADTPGPVPALFDRLARVPCPLGCFGVVGNNDREVWPDLDALREIAARSGCRLLVNAAADVALPGGTLTVAGVDDYSHGAPDVQGLYPRAASADRYRLLLSHFPIMPDPLPDAMLCGHTHGGQFNVLGFTPYTIGFERGFLSNRPSRFISGMHTWRGTRVLVSKGIGASRVPLRLCVRPEAELIEFC